MSERRAFDRITKRRALVVWIGLCAALLVAMLVPLYWFWDRLASRPGVLVTILGLLAWALFNWWKMATLVAKQIRHLPQK